MNSAADAAATMPAQTLAATVADQRGGERAHQELALDRDVDHAGALAQHAGERAEDQRQRQQQRTAAPTSPSGMTFSPVGAGETCQHRNDSTTPTMPTPEQPGEPAPGHAGEQRGAGRDGDQPEQDGADRAGDADRGAGGRLAEREPGLLVGGERAEDDGRERASDDQPRPTLRCRVQNRTGSATTISSTVIDVIGSPALRHAGLQAAPLAAARSRKTAFTSAGAATKITISACSTPTSSSEMPENDCIRLPPACSAPNSSAASRTPHGLTRPSSADQDAVEADAADDRVGQRVAAVPSTIMVPPRPASAPATTITRTYVRGHVHAGGTGRVGVEPDRAQLEAERRALEQPGHAPGGQTASTMPEVQPQAWPDAEQPGQLRPIVHRLADRVRARRVLDAVLEDEPAQEVERDVVEHDRGDDLVGAGAGLEDARQEAPDRAADGAREQRHDQVQHRPAAAAGSRPAPRRSRP